MFRNLFRKLNGMQPRVFAGVAAASLALTLPTNQTSLPSFAKCERGIKTQFDVADLAPGKPKQNTLFLVHDSRVPTQVEFIVDLQYRQGYETLNDSIQLVHLDVSRHNCGDLVDVEKVSSKNRPTFMLRANDSLHKIKPEVFERGYPFSMDSELHRLTSNKLVWSRKDLATALEENQKSGYESMTIVYSHSDAECKSYPEQAFRLLRHESTH